MRIPMDFPIASATRISSVYLTEEIGRQWGSSEFFAPKYLKEKYDGYYFYHIK